MTTTLELASKCCRDHAFVSGREIVSLNPLCVACGPENPNGLRLTFCSSGDRVYASWSPSALWASFQGTIHGGIVSTVLDEAMSKAVITAGEEALTAELRVRFRARIVPGDQLKVVAWVVKKRRGLIVTEAMITGPSGKEQAHAWGKFLTS